MKCFIARGLVARVLQRNVSTKHHVYVCRKLRWDKETLKSACNRFLMVVAGLLGGENFSSLFWSPAVCDGKIVEVTCRRSVGLVEESHLDP